METFFSPDSKIMQAMNRMADLVLLNLLFLLTCLPVFTVGAANTALYTVCFRMDTPREEGLFSTYFRAFRRNFLQSSLLFLILALLTAASAVNGILFVSLGGGAGLAGILLSVLLLLLTAFTAGYAYPLQSRFSDSVGSTLKNALLLSIAHLPRTLILTALNLLPWILFFLNFYAFIQLGFVWVFVYFSVAAYCCSRLLNAVFAPYSGQEENTP